MTKQEKIQLLKDIKAGKKSLHSVKPEMWMSIRVAEEAFYYNDTRYSKIEIDQLVAKHDMNFELSIIWIDPGNRLEPIQGATPLTLNLSESSFTA